MDKYRCTAPSCEFIANSVKIAYSHKEETGHTLERMGTQSRLSPSPAVGFGQAVMTEGWFRYFLTFTDEGILWEKQTWSPKSSKVPARVEHDQMSYSAIKSITYEEVDRGPRGLFDREHLIWKGWYITLTNGMRFPITDDGQHGQMIAAIKEQMKLWGRKATATSSSTVSTREVIKEIKEVVLIQCRSCGARYQQGTPRCLTCGANL